MVEIETDNQPLSHDGVGPAKIQDSQQQLVRKYKTLLARYNRIKDENSQLREEIEQFNSKLIEREKELEELDQRLEDVFSLLKQIQHEEHRLPSFQARAAVKKQIFHQDSHLVNHVEHEEDQDPEKQELVALNVWLVTRNRFVDKVVGPYTRKRDHVLVIRNYEFVKQLLTIGMLPDIIITGTYDFGLDDPNHKAFFEFLDQVFSHLDDPPELREFFVITLSSSIPAQPSITAHHQGHITRHEFISKFRGLQVAISEVRFFLEMRRCQPDIMKAEETANIHSMGDVARVMLSIQQHQKTGLLIVLSNDQASDVRWSFLLFFLNGKLVKTEHTLESSVLFSSDDNQEPLEKIFTLSTLNDKYSLSAPCKLYFFSLYHHAVLRELQEPLSPTFQEDF